VAVVEVVVASASLPRGLVSCYGLSEETVDVCSG